MVLSSCDTLYIHTYKTNKERLTKFQGHFRQVMRDKLGIDCEGTRDEDLHGAISSLLTEEDAEFEQRIDELNEAIILASNKSFPIYRATRSTTLHKTVPLWSTDLTVLRKRTNAPRRLYQRTRNDEELRGKRKTQYFVYTQGQICIFFHVISLLMALLHHYCCKSDAHLGDVIVTSPSF